MGGLSLVANSVGCYSLVGHSLVGHSLGGDGLAAYSARGYSFGNYSLQPRIFNRAMHSTTRKSLYCGGLFESKLDWRNFSAFQFVVDEKKVGKDDQELRRANISQFLLTHKPIIHPPV